MNNMFKPFSPSLAIVPDQVVQAIEEQNEAASAPVPLPVERKPLLGYESSMRRHAAACEAGR
jgi:hypothetical protein